MSSTPTRSQWIIILSVNVLVSAFTTWLVVRTLTAPPVVYPGNSQNPTAQTIADAPSATMTVNPTATPQPSPLPPRPTSTGTAKAAVTPTPTQQPTRTPPPAATAIAASAAKVQISTVLYPGQRQREVVVIVNEGNTVSMKGWKLSSSRDIVYVFGDVTLPKDSFVSLHTTSGSDVPTDIFMNRTESAWQVGDVITLAQENLQLATITVRNQ